MTTDKKNAPPPPEIKPRRTKSDKVSLSASDLLKPYIARSLLYVVLVGLSTLFMVASLFSATNFLQVLFGTSEKLTANRSSIGKALPDTYIYDFYEYIIGFGQMRALFYFAAIVFILYLLKDLTTYAASYVVATIRNKIVRNIRQALFKKYMSLPLVYFIKHRKGDFLSRISNDVIEYDENVLLPLQQISTAVIGFAFYFGTLFYIDSKLTLFALLIIPLLSSLAVGLKKRLKRPSAHMQQKTSHLLAITEETIAGLPIIKSYTAIDLMNERFRKFNRSYTRLRNKIYRRVALASPQSEFLGNLMLVIILMVGSFFIANSNSKLSPELFIVYLATFALVINPAKDISNAMHNLKKGKASAARIADILNWEDSIEEVAEPIPLRSFSNCIEYRNVSFAYRPGKPVLHSVSFRIPKGKTVALVGHSGSGKTTLMDLLPRFYDCTDGNILIDGTDIRNFALKDLRSLFGLVSQHSVLFHETVFWNLTFGNPKYSKEDVISAAKMAYAHDFISQLPMGYETVIGDRGSLLSGGQRQRLSLARALLHAPEILLLDEATSALDTEAERNVQEAIQAAMQGRTSLVIAHRLSTIKNADEIIVLDHGKIIQRGTHTELYQDTTGTYRNLCDMQSLQ